MNVNEIFESFQGEGPNLGVPSIFLRLSGCNLRCVFCDTKYTWLFSEKTLLQIKEAIPVIFHTKLGNKVYSKQEETKQTETEDLVGIITGYKAQNIVITGGEPLLQTSDIITFLNHPAVNHYNIEIETNGTLPPIDRSLLPHDVNLKYNVSPKLSNSFNEYDSRIKQEILEMFVSENSIFKFVISDSEDILEIAELLDLVRINPSRVYLMPEATNKSDLSKRGKMVAELAMNNNYNYSHRLHVEFYGDQRGV
jgi:organic radical activating enzyme